MENVHYIERGVVFPTTSLHELTLPSAMMPEDLSVVIYRVHHLVV